MPRVIKGGLATGGRIVEDSWHEVADEAGLLAVPRTLDVLVPLALWRGAQAQLLAREGRRGVRLGAADDGGELAPFLERLALVAVEFPVFSDGRGFSTARLLRERYGYRGELRAVGDVLRDQIYYMLRCGFDAFALRADKDPEEALAAYHDFSESYQAAVDQPVPLYRRRLQGPALAEPNP